MQTCRLAPRIQHNIVWVQGTCRIFLSLQFVCEDYLHPLQNNNVSRYEDENIQDESGGEYLGETKMSRVVLPTGIRSQTPVEFSHR